MKLVSIFVKTFVPLSTDYQVCILGPSISISISRLPGSVCDVLFHVFYMF